MLERFVRVIQDSSGAIENDKSVRSRPATDTSAAEIFLCILWQPQKRLDRVLIVQLMRPAVCQRLTC